MKTKIFLSLSLLVVVKLTYSQDFWEITNYNYDQQVHGLIVDANNNLFAGNNGGSILKSSDYGKNWTRIQYQFNSVYSLAMNKTNGYMFAGTYENGIHRSIDQGNSWLLVGLRGETIRAVAVNSANGYIFASYPYGWPPGGIYRSIDNGNTWKVVGLQYVRVASITLDKNGTIYAGYESGVSASNDNGDNWHYLGPENEHVLSIAIRNTNDNIFLVTEHGVFRSEDNGNSWSQVFVSNNYYCYSIIVDRLGHLFVGTTGGGVYHSANNGDNWELKNAGLTDHNVFSFAIDSTGFLYVGGGGHVHKSIQPIQPSKAPALFAPQNNSKEISLTPTLYWNSVTGAVVYRIQISTDISFNTTIVDVGTLTSSHYQVPDGTLSANTIYYWRVNATNIAGTSQWPLAWNFTTMNLPPPAPPQLFLPANGSSSVSVTPRFDWDDVTTATSYRIQVSTVQDFTIPVIDANEITESLYEVPSGKLMQNTLYYWHVNASNQSVSGDWSDRWSFTTLITLTRPEPIFPPDNSIAQSLTPKLDWKPVQGATNYRVQVSTNINFPTTVIDILGLIESEYTVPFGRLTDNILYYWRVKAFHNQVDSSEWSLIWRFRTSLPNGVEMRSDDIPTEFKLFQNHPNPFNPVTKISFSLSQNSFVTLKVFDILGKEVMTLANEKKQAGIYSLTFDATNLPSSLYFYRIEAGSFVESKKMLFLK